MRLSLRKDDPAYNPAATHCKVFLEGVQRTDVLTADEERRYALLEKRDEHGRPVIAQREIQTVEFWGHVRIETPPWWDDVHGDCADC